ncbi:hypothetical protein FOXB_03143, partial [Fusarium oxysporum f. sp. conglutinans Fo5176]
NYTKFYINYNLVYD